MGFGSWLRDLTKDSDIFGRVVSLYIEGGREHKTTTGGLFSMILVLLILAYGYESASALFNRKDPTYTQTSSFVQTPGQINTDSPEFYFAINVSSGVVEIQPHSGLHYFNYSFTQIICPSNTVNCSYLDLGLQACDAQYFASYSNMLNFATASYCPVHKDYNLSGEPLGDYYPGRYSSYIRIVVSACVNSTNYTCHTQEDINQVLTDPNLAIYIIYANNYVAITDYNEPIKRVVGFAGGRIAPNDFDLVFTEYLDEIEVQSNDGLLKANVTKHSTYYVNPLSQSLATSDPTDQGIYFTLNFRRSQMKYIYQRQYLTISGVLSDIGGFSLSMMAALGFLMYAYSRLKYKIYFSNEMYRFSEKPVMGIFANNTSIELPLLDPNSVNLEENAVNQPSNRLGNTKIGHYLAVKSHPDFSREGKLIVNFKDYMAYSYTCGCCKNKQTEKIVRAEDKIAKDSDIIDMARLCKHIEKLRDFTLEPDQRTVFNSFKDPFVLIEAEEEEEEFADLKKAFKQKNSFVDDIKFKELDLCMRRYKAFINLSKDSNNPMNSKIINQLDRDMIEFFQELRDLIGDDFEKLPEVFADSLLLFNERVHQHNKKK